MSRKTVLVSVLVFFAAIVGISVQLTNKPSVETSGGFFDFGEIKVSDVKEKDFVLTNTGTKSLQILNINSSCNCTTGKIIYNGSETKEYGMHAQSGYLLDIAPNTEAKIRVIYRPSIMPVYGAVEREVYVTTNDPQREKLIFAIKANVR